MTSLRHALALTLGSGVSVEASVGRSWGEKHGGSRIKKKNSGKWRKVVSLEMGGGKGAITPPLVSKKGKQVKYGD